MVSDPLSSSAGVTRNGDGLGAIGADTSSGMLRPSDVEALSLRIEQLQRERQELRFGSCSAATLERNRRELAAAQRALSVALIDRHRPASGATQPSS
jgi:hypothetical protein